MARYIDADRLSGGLAYAFLRGNYSETTRQQVDIICKMLMDEPRADVVEVRHGYNKTSMHPVDEFWCSECGFCCADYAETKYDEDGDYTYSCECEFDYCPKCGAKMDGKENGNAGSKN